MIKTQENGEEPHFGPDVSPLGQIQAKICFKKIWLRHSLDIMVNYHAKYQKKIMIQSWENLVTDGQTDEGDYIGRFPTDVERPIVYIIFHYICLICNDLLTARQLMSTSWLRID